MRHALEAQMYVYYIRTLEQYPFSVDIFGNCQFIYDLAALIKASYQNSTTIAVKESISSAFSFQQSILVGCYRCPGYAYVCVCVCNACVAYIRGGKNDCC